MDFEFRGKKENDLKLNTINIGRNEQISTFLNDSVKLGQINPPIEKVYKFRNEFDYFHEPSLTYHLYSRGISFKLDSVKGGLKLTEISVHYIINKQ
jgi:hypothetical protein